MWLSIQHTTRFDYSEPVSEAYTEIRLKPRHRDGQRCSSFALETEPGGIHVDEHYDSFGNSVLHFDLLDRHDTLAVTVRSEVWTPAAFADEAGAPSPLDRYDYLQPTRYVPIDGPVGALATARLADPGDARLDDALALVQAVRAGMRYERGSTTVHTRADQALADGAGVCQDFAHVLLGACRARGIIARYVSGYLYAPEADETASHAWVDVFADGRWVSLDQPTTACRTSTTCASPWAATTPTCRQPAACSRAPAPRRCRWTCASRRCRPLRRGAGPPGRGAASTRAGTIRSMELQGKAALVTGGGTGCGRAIAVALARAGCDVAVNYARSREAAEGVADEIRALGRRAAAVQGDVSRQAEAHRVVAEAAAAVGDGGLDVLVNNAGMTRGVPLGRIQEITEDDWRGIMDLNAGAHLWTAQAAAPLMAARGGGSILNVTSNSAVTYLSSSLVYVVSKVAANALTRMLARAVPEGVRVNAIAPGWMDTRWIDAYVLPELRDRVRSGDLPVTSLESVASMAVEIIRNEGMVGETVVIDAGELARG